MLLHDRHHGIVGVAMGPVALPFEQDLLPGHRHAAGLDHAVHRVLMCVAGGAAGGVRDHVDLVAPLQHGAEREGGVADLGPEARDDDLLAAVCGERVADILVVPGVHRGALEDLVLREHRQQLGIGMA